MPDFIDITLRVRKEKLGDLICDMPAYCKPVNMTRVEWEAALPEAKAPTKAAKAITDVVKLLKHKRRIRRWKTTPADIVNQIKTLRNDGMTAVAIADKLKISKATVYRNQEHVS